MCNHFRNIPGAHLALQSWREYVGWSISRALPPELQSTPEDAWPKRQSLIVRNGEDGAYFDMMQWGVPLTLPGKRPGTTITKNITNVRNLASPFWRSMLARPEQRCLVPFSSFAEPKPNAGREEIWFRVADEHPAAFAGIWRPSEQGNVFAFLTCEPNPMVAPYHPKAMPVILHRESYQSWLDGASATELATPFPSQLMEILDA
jgi:putative SOS response-associated peptidase YedK